MPAQSQLKGILLMLASTATFVLGDTFMKLASENLPALELVFLRAVVSFLACAAAVTYLGQWQEMRGLSNPRTFLRGTIEALASVLFMLALSTLAIANLFAIAQTIPLFLLLGAAVIYGDRLTPWQALLAIIGFGGALLVAQPDFSGMSIGMVFAFSAAICVAGRDLIGRGVPETIPAVIVACATSVIIILLAGALLLVVGEWQTPSLLNAVYITCAGLCVAIGQSAVVLAYRNADTTTLAPLLYSFAVWSVLSGLLIWSELPNTAALIGIAIIVVSGLILVRLGQKPAAPQS